MGKAQIAKKRKVAVLLWMGGGGARNQLAGIARCAHAPGSRWDFELVQNFGALTVEHVRQAKAAGVAGFIVGVKPADRAAVDALVAADLPVAAIDVTDYARCRRLALVRTDDNAIGVAGAEHLLSLGRFNAFGFVPDLSYGGEWSATRGHAFAARLRVAGFACETCPITPSPDPNATRGAVKQWIAGLVKPAAVMCACDYTAARTIDVCREIGLDVPREVAVLGVDNETLCDYTSPSISSVLPDFVDEGFRAAAALDRMIRGRKCQAALQWGHVVSVVERGSTRPVAPVGRLIHDAQVFIESQALSGVRVDDVAAHLHVSRRLLDLRFRQMTGTTVLGALTARRVEEARHRLLETHWRLSRIARFCGFRSEDVFARTFRRVTGESPSEFRAAASQRTDIVRPVAVHDSHSPVGSAPSVAGLSASSAPYVQ